MKKKLFVLSFLLPSLLFSSCGQNGNSSSSGGGDNTPHSGDKYQISEEKFQKQIDIAYVVCDSNYKMEMKVNGEKYQEYTADKGKLVSVFYNRGAFGESVTYFIKAERIYQDTAYVLDYAYIYASSGKRYYQTFNRIYDSKFSLLSDFASSLGFLFGIEYNQLTYDKDNHQYVGEDLTVRTTTGASSSYSEITIDKVIMQAENGNPKHFEFTISGSFVTIDFTDIGTTTVDPFVPQVSKEYVANESVHYLYLTNPGYEDVIYEYGSHKGDDTRHYIEPTFEECGYYETSYDCEVCGYHVYKKEPVGEPKEHNYAREYSYDETYHWKACTDEGYEHLKNDVEKHDMETYRVYPTPFDEGYDYCYCTKCNYNYKTNFVNPVSCIAIDDRYYYMDEVEVEEDSDMLRQFYGQLCALKGEQIALYIDGELVTDVHIDKDVNNNLNEDLTVKERVDGEDVWVHVYESGWIDIWVGGYTAPVDEDPEEGYAVVVNGSTRYALTYEGEWDMDKTYTQYSYKNGISLNVNDVVSLYDYKNKTAWYTITLDPASSGNFKQGSNGLVCGKSGKYDVYLKLKYQNDNIYFGNHI